MAKVKTKKERTILKLWLWHWIHTTRMKGVTFDNPPDRQGRPFKDAILFICFHGISRTRRIKTASWTQNGGDQILIGLYQSDKDLLKRQFLL